MLRRISEPHVNEKLFLNEQKLRIADDKIKELEARQEIFNGLIFNSGDRNMKATADHVKVKLD